MPEWLNTSLIILVILVQLSGFFGLFLVFFPGLTVIWIGQLAWALITGFNQSHEPWQFTLTIVVFVINTILMAGGNLIDNVLMAGNACKRGATWWGIGLSWLAMIIGGIFLTPVGGLATAFLVLFLVEWARVKDHLKAFESTKSMALGCGWAVVVRIALALVMMGLWILVLLVF